MITPLIIMNKQLAILLLYKTKKIQGSCACSKFGHGCTTFYGKYVQVNGDDTATFGVWDGVADILRHQNKNRAAALTKGLNLPLHGQEVLPDEARPLWLTGDPPSLLWLCLRCCSAVHISSFARHEAPALSLCRQGSRWGWVPRLGCGPRQLAEVLSGPFPV